MAKQSMVAREVKRAKMVAQYAEKRAALKEIVRKGEPAEAYEAARKLQSIPKLKDVFNSNTPCSAHGVRSVEPLISIPKSELISLKIFFKLGCGVLL